MKNIAIILSLVFIAVLGFEIKSLYSGTEEARAKYEQSRQEFFRVKSDSDKLRADLDYYLNPQNLEKELRSRFNYKKPDEKLIIIVPAISSTTNQ